MEVRMIGTINSKTNNNEYRDFKTKKLAVVEVGDGFATFFDANKEIIGYRSESGKIDKTFHYMDKSGNVIGVGKNISSIEGDAYYFETELFIANNGSKGRAIRQWGPIGDTTISIYKWNPMSEMLEISKSCNQNIMKELKEFSPSVRNEFLKSNITSKELLKILENVRNYSEKYTEFFGTGKFNPQIFKLNMNTDIILELSKLSDIYKKVLLPTQISQQVKETLDESIKLKNEYNSEYTNRKNDLGMYSMIFHHSKNANSIKLLNEIKDRITNLNERYKTLEKISKFINDINLDKPVEFSELKSNERYKLIYKLKESRSILNSSKENLINI